MLCQSSQMNLRYVFSFVKPQDLKINSRRHLFFFIFFVLFYVDNYAKNQDIQKFIENSCALFMPLVSLLCGHARAFYHVFPFFCVSV
jgi:hypothetical protein